MGSSDDPTAHTRPSMIPPYLRPTNSRQHSTSTMRSTSTSRSRRFHSQNEYEPISAGIGTAAGGAEGTFPTEEEARRMVEDDEDDSDFEGDDDADGSEWDTILETAHSDVPAWRRPRPAWMYPFVGITVMTVGMGLAPKSEAYVELACLAHPPSAPSSAVSAGSIFNIIPSASQVSAPWIDDSTFGSIDDSTFGSINGSLPAIEPMTSTIQEINPVDKWFLELQRKMYEYEKDRYEAAHPQATVVPTPTQDLPRGPLPQPTSTPDTSPTPSKGTTPRSGTPTKDGLPPYREIDPEQCKKDPQVQAIAAKLTMILTFCLGFLSALTTASWGQLSDRIGRKRVIALLQLGPFANDIVFILVATNPHRMPGGYRSLVLGPIIEGLMGGMSASVATVHAYAADTTPDGSRAGAFSTMTGAVMVGFALGPVIGSFLISLTGSILTPFYVNLVIHVVWICLVLLIVPESLSPQARAYLKRKAARARALKRRKEALQREWESQPADQDYEDAGASGWSFASNAGHSTTRKRAAGMAHRSLQRIFGFLEPLSVFYPTERQDGRSGKNWTLLLLALVHFCGAFNFGVMQLKGPYTIYSYGWSSAELGPYLSLLGACRGVVLIVLLPVFMRFARAHLIRKAQSKNDIPSIAPAGAGTAADSASPADPGPSTEIEGTLTITEQPASSPIKTIQFVKLDKRIAQAAMLLESIGLTTFALGLPAFAFVLASVIITPGAAGPPALNSLALYFAPSRRETGRLLGAMSVISALGMTLIGPLVYTNIYALTVGIYAPTVFAVSATVSFIGQIILMFVRVEEREDAGAERSVANTPARPIKNGQSNE